MKSIEEIRQEAIGKLRKTKGERVDVAASTAQQVGDILAATLDVWLRGHVGHFADVVDTTPTPPSLEWPDPPAELILRRVYCSFCDDTFTFRVTDGVGR